MISSPHQLSGRDSEEKLKERFPEIEEWSSALELLPTDKEELEDMASEKRYKARTMTCNNPDALASYDQLQAEVTTLKLELEANKALYVQKKSEIDDLKVCQCVSRREAIGECICWIIGTLAS